MPIASVRSAAKAVLGRLTQRSQIEAYLREHERPKLNIGCGYNRLEGWMNVDLVGGRGGTIFMDATRRFPLPDDTLEAVLCEHMIEHIPREAAPGLLAEAFRVLAPGGRARIVTPDVEGLAGLCVSPPSPRVQAYLDFVADLHGRASITPAEALNYIFYEYGHRHIYSIDGLREMMAAAGFVDIVESRAGHPVHPIFEGAEGHPGFMGLENDATEAFALEGRKPDEAT